MIHVKKNIRDSLSVCFFFLWGGGGGGELQMTFKKIKTVHAVWIGVNYVANNIILQ